MKRLIALAVIVLLAITTQAAMAAEREGWILCQPDSYVNARWLPDKGSDIIGRLELGDRIVTDGERKGDYIHCVGLRFESNEGWIHRGYITWDEPRITEETWTVTAGGRTACRRYANGPRRCWAKRGSSVTVYAVSNEWALTDKGFVKTKYIKPTEVEP